MTALFSLVSCTMLEAEKTARPPLRVAYNEWWGDYTLLVAQEKGFFESHGIQVEPVYYDIYSKTHSDLASGQIDAAFIAIGDAINVSRYIHVKAVGISDDGGADAIIAGPEINSVEDLKGKTVGILLGTQYELLITEMLRSANMSPVDVTLVGIDPENALNALNSDQAQAVYAWEPFLSEAVSKGKKIIYEKKTLFPDLIVFNTSIIENRPEDVQAFLEAWFEAVDYRIQNPQETRSIAAKYLGVNIEDVPPDDSLKLLTLEENKALFELDEENSIYDVTRRTSDYLISIGALAQQIDPLELLNPDFLP